MVFITSRGKGFFMREHLKPHPDLWQDGSASKDNPLRELKPGFAGIIAKWMFL